MTGEKRTPFLPDVPTMKEQGFNVVVESLSGVFVPAKTPAPIVAALNAAMRKATRVQTNDRQPRQVRHRAGVS